MEQMKAWRIELGHLLKKARLDAGLSRWQMALKLELADFYAASLPKTLRDTIYFWEIGQYAPRTEILERYTERFGVRVPYFCRHNQHWTNKELQHLRVLVTNGKSDKEIARLLGRTQTAVFYQRKHRLGIHLRHCWTDAEDSRLRRLLTTTELTLSEIATQMNRTEGSIERRKEKLGIRRTPFKLDKLNPIHVAQVIKFKMAGWTQARIADIWGLKNPSQISNVLIHHGLHRFYTCVGKKEQKAWSEVELHLLRKYLMKGMPLTMIYREFPHRSPSSIASKARKITQYYLPRETQEKWERHHRRWVNRTEFYIKGDLTE